MIKVMCFGTFDVLHLGHISYFKQAKKYGDSLIVVIARDITKKNLKKELIFDEQERLELVSSLSVVEKAVLGDKIDHLKIIEELNPDVICLGYDQKVNKKELEKELLNRGLKVKVVRAKELHPHKYKSSIIKNDYDS